VIPEKCNSQFSFKKHGIYNNSDTINSLNNRLEHWIFNITMANRIIIRIFCEKDGAIFIDAKHAF